MNSLEAFYHAAIAEHRAGRIEEAAQICQQILAQDQTFARAWELWGLVLHEQGHSEQAVDCIGRAIGLEPQWPGFYHDLGSVLATLGRYEEAEAALRQAVALMPGNLSGLAAHGKVLYALGRTEESLAVFERLLALCVENPVGLAAAYGELGLAEEAMTAYRRANESSPDPGLLIRAAVQLPPVYESREHVLACRRRLEKEVDALIAAGDTQSLETREAAPVFALAHQGLNDVEIQKKLARLYVPPQAPAVVKASGPGDKLRVGFISRYFDFHTVAKLTSGLITRLANDFHVTVFSVGQDSHPLTKALAAAVQRFVPVPRDLPQARRAILENPVDVMVYTDIGMDPTTYSLAFSRLASVQCVTWGHSETTGIEAIDYFISSELMETAEADAHYSEKLVRMPGLSLVFDRWVPPVQRADWAAFGLDTKKRLYACPQTIYKFHPDFDEALAGILRRDSEAQIVLIRSEYPHHDEMLRQRFSRVMPDVANRIVFLRRLKQAEFLNLLTLADVVLDPFPYGGCTSSLEAFACATPVVTLPTKLLRGRFTQAFYRRLGVASCIARDVVEYIETALRLGTDRNFREEVQRQIVAGWPRLFDDVSAVEDWKAFLLRAVNEQHAHVANVGVRGTGAN